MARRRRRRRRKYPRSATITLGLIARAVGLADAEAVAIVLGAVGIPINRWARVPSVTLGRLAARRLGLVQIAGRWRLRPGWPPPEDRGWPRGAGIHLEAMRSLPADHRTPSPLDELIAREEPPGRISSLSHWLAEWSQTGRRPRPPRGYG